MQAFFSFLKEGFIHLKASQNHRKWRKYKLFLQVRNYILFCSSTLENSAKKKKILDVKLLPDFLFSITTRNRKVWEMGYKESLSKIAKLRSEPRSWVIKLQSFGQVTNENSKICFAELDRNRLKKFNEHYFSSELSTFHAHDSCNPTCRYHCTHILYLYLEYLSFKGCNFENL